MVAIDKGYPQPYGPSYQDKAINFALFSKAEAVTLCLFKQNKGDHPFLEIPLNPEKNKTGDIWHVLVHDLPSPLYYAYKIEDSLLLDPYAKGISSREKWGNGEDYHPLGMISPKESFDWEGDQHPFIPREKLMIYELHVRGFTCHPSSQVTKPGTFLGIVDKIPYLLDLGVNAVELLPIHEFNELEYSKTNPSTKQRLLNYWGYSSVNFFSPMSRYAANPKDAVNEFKTMIKAFHQNHMEVILDVVFNHTAEGNEQGPTLSFKGVEKSSYYLLDNEGEFYNFTGCGNTFNCNHPVVIQFILDCLRYWVLEMHVDGFRFDLASIFSRGMEGQFLPQSPIVEAIALDPILSQTKLIAEPWDAAGIYQVGSFFLRSDRWGEWNGKYRDIVRCFIKGTLGFKGKFATCLAGSQDLYNQRSPLCSYNFVTIHDGFTLADLVAYNQKHNLQNGENNQDGMSDNESWNCGVEGPTLNHKVLAIRQRQMKNFHLALMFSFGIPMLLMGDEYGHTKKGNNNSWCQDNELNWFLWDKWKEKDEFYRFYRALIHFRSRHSLLQRKTFLTEEDIQWHGLKPFQPGWDQPTNFLSFTLIDHENGEHLYAAFNAQGHAAFVEFPQYQDSNKTWHLIVNTSNRSPQDYVEEKEAQKLTSTKYTMLPFSALMMKLKD